jgi:4-amino-4-deoxy-L-arabinose transferase-like glycosyltransferase
MTLRNWSESVRNHKYLIGVWILLTFLLLFRLDSIPPLSFDEGWIMTVARNLVELGHYGRLINGEPYQETIINIGIPVIAPIALSFYLFGVGILQARITIVLFTLAALFVFYKLVGRLYNSKIAFASLLAILILPFNFELNSIFVGRQALGELPALFYMITGYIFFLFSQRKSWAIILAVIFWVLAILSKFQILPFLCLGLIVPAIVMLIKRNKKQAMLFGI